MDEKEKIQAQQELEQLQVYSLFDRDFSLAQASIKVLKHFRQLHPAMNKTMENLTSALIRDAVVSYSRPWLQSKGLYKKTHQLDHKKYVPPHLLKVHENLLDIRHREIAHTDLDLKNPNVIRYVTKEGIGVYPVGYHSTDYEHMFGLIDFVDELLAHVREIMKFKVKELNERQERDYKAWKEKKMKGESG